MAQTIRLKRQIQSGASAAGKKPTVNMLQDGELAVNTVDGKLFLKKTPATGLPEIVEVGANPFPDQSNNAGKFLVTDGTNVSWATPNTVSAAAIDITQSNHDFELGQVVYHDGTDYQLARADSTLTADVIGIITSIKYNPALPSGKEGFTLTTNGFIDFENTSLNPGWVAGQTYYLSPIAAGVMTPDEPVQAGTINKPLIIAISSTRAFFYNWRGIFNEIPYSDIDDLLPPQNANTTGMVLTSGADGNAYWAQGGVGGSGSSSSISVTQTSHGFTVGNLVRYDGTAGIQRYVPAQADNGTNADVVGIVSTVNSVDSFTITTQGMINNLAGLTPGASYFLSDTTAGAYQITEPTNFTAISKPVLLAVSTTSALFTNWRGIAISTLQYVSDVAPQAGHSGKYLSTNGISTVWNTPVTSFNTRTGAVTLTSSDIASALGYTPYNGTTNPNNYVTASGAVTSFNARVGTVTLLLSDIVGAGGAPSASPVFTGNPTAPTPATGDNDTSIATTAFVQSAIQMAGRNSQGNKTLSTAAPTGTGSAGDIWYQY